MTTEDNGLVAVVKRDCPTCELVEPALKRLRDAGALVAVYSQDDPDFPETIDGVRDDRSLERSFRLDVEFVPTLIRIQDGKESGRVFGWNREEWEGFTGIQGIGEGLPENQPGCGSRSVEPGVAERLQARYGEVPFQSRKVEFSDWDDVVEQAFDRGWTDGLPIVPPTDERILRMLGGTDRAPDEIVGIMPPDMKECTVEKIAINAVMAGARPEYMPVILATIEAALE
ncbi:MAG: thioredoxin, partial [Pseudomonadota bacterium]